MKIRITRSTVVNRTDVYVGDVVETDDIQGQLLINLKKAVLLDDVVEEPKKQVVVDIPKRRGRKPNKASD